MQGPTWSVILLLINVILTLQACDDVTEFQCVDDKKCISKTETCNTINDCTDGSDEQNCACLDKLGMEDGTILDSSLIASSSKEGSSPLLARASNDKGHWCPKSDDAKPFFKVKFDEPRAIAGIVFTLKQPVIDPLKYLTTWTLKAVLPGSDDEVTLYEDLNALSDNSLYRSLFFPAFVTDTFIIVPTTWQIEPCLSFELRGCNIDDLCPGGCKSGGKCSGNNVCSCPDGYFGTKCQFEKTTIPFRSYLFTSLASGSLVTSTETLSIQTVTSVSTSKLIEIQGKKVLNLPVEDYFTALKDGNFECLSKLGSEGCKSFYLSLECELGEFSNPLSVQLFSTGPDSTYIGAEAILKSDNIVVTFRTSELKWSLIVQKTNMFSSSVKYGFEFDWDISTGIRVYINKKLVGQQRQATRTTTVLRTNTQTTSAVEFFKSKSVDVKVFSLKSSIVNRVSLIKTSLVSLTGPEECDQKKEYKCANSDKCIAKSKVCDSVEDCDDGSDEQNCPTKKCDVKNYKTLVTKSASLTLDLFEVDDAQREAKCTLPVISYVVDEILLDFLSKNQYRDQLAASNGFAANKNNNNDENNNNNKSYQDEFQEEVSNWADEPWTPCSDVDVPDWAKMEDSTLDGFNPNLIWAEDPWTQEPLVGLPSWMVLPGIDDVTKEDPLEETEFDNGEDDAAFLASGIEVGNWGNEPYFQLPLDVPRWALLPGIDYPARHGYNSPYWKFKVNDYTTSRQKFRKRMVARELPTLGEEPVLCSEQPRLFAAEIDCPEDPVAKKLHNDEDEVAFLASAIEVANWSDEPYFQLPLDVPGWALLPGIDCPARHGYNSPYWKFKLNDYTTSRQKFRKGMVARELPTLGEEPVLCSEKPRLCAAEIDCPEDPVAKKLHNDEDEVAFLASAIEVANWSDEPYFQLPLDVPGWALLPGIDCPARHGYNSPYWTFKVNDYTTSRQKFRKRMVARELPTLGEEPVLCSEQPRLCTAEIDCPEDPVAKKLHNDEDEVAFLASAIEVANWSDEPYFQLPLDVPRWALLPGIDCPARHGYNSPYWTFKVNDYTTSRQKFRKRMVARELPTLGEEPVLCSEQSRLCAAEIDCPEDPVAKKLHNDEDEVAFLASAIEVANWSDETYFQLPLDVPIWALLPGIDYPTRRGYNSPYWKYKVNDYTTSRQKFRKRMVARELPTLGEEPVPNNNNGQSKLCVPRQYIRKNHTF